MLTNPLRFKCFERLLDHTFVDRVAGKTIENANFKGIEREQKRLEGTGWDVIFPATNQKVRGSNPFWRAKSKRQNEYVLAF